MNKATQTYLCLCLALFMSSCGNRQQEPNHAFEQAPQAVPAETREADTADADMTVSAVSKGIIKSMKDVSVYCNLLNEQVLRVNMKEGVQVHAGQVLVEQDEEELRTQLVQARNEFEQAKFQYEEILVGQGYKREHFNQVPENVIRQARVKSGYNIKEVSVQYAQRQLEKCQVKAPISGVVTNVKIYQYDKPQSSTPICHIIDIEHLKVVFYILGSERQRISIGHKVSITTIAYNKEFHLGTVSMISPEVDENGMIKIEAVIEDSVKLMPGMTAFVNIL